MNNAQASFQLRIQKILEVKRKREQALKLEIARIERDIRKIDHRTNVARTARRAAMRALRRARVQGRARFHPSHADYLQALASRIERCDHHKEGLRQSKQGATERLEKAVRSRRLLEKHEDKLKAQLSASIEKREQEQMDGHSIRRFVQRGDRT